MNQVPTAPTAQQSNLFKATADIFSFKEDAELRWFLRDFRNMAVRSDAFRQMSAERAGEFCNDVDILGDYLQELANAFYAAKNEKEVANA